MAFTFVSYAYAQSIDEQIGNAMNNQSWHQLRSLYEKDGNKIQVPFLKPLSKFFLAHFFNQPDSALYYGNVLLTKYQTEIGGSAPSILFYMADDAARLGKFDDASQILDACNEVIAQSGQAPIDAFVGHERQYKAMYQAGGFRIDRPYKTVKVPFIYYSGKRDDPVSIYVDVLINGKPARVNYDTGAGANVMSRELAENLGIKSIDEAGITVNGVSNIKSSFAIVDSLRFGEIVYRNVPFQIIDFSTGNAEADAKLKATKLNCVLGSQTMMPLGEIQFDFASQMVIIPEKPSETPIYAPNMYRSGNYGFIIDLYDYTSRDHLEALLDTGAAYCGLTNKYYQKNRDLFKGRSATDSIRYAGAGGIGISKVFHTNLKYKIGDRTVKTDSIAVAVEGDIQASTHDMLYGLPEMTKFNKMIINFRRMWVGME